MWYDNNSLSHAQLHNAPATARPHTSHQSYLMHSHQNQQHHTPTTQPSAPSFSLTLPSPLPPSQQQQQPTIIPQLSPRSPSHPPHSHPHARQHAWNENGNTNGSNGNHHHATGQTRDSSIQAVYLPPTPRALLAAAARPSSMQQSRSTSKKSSLATILAAQGNGVKHHLSPLLNNHGGGQYQHQQQQPLQPKAPPVHLNQQQSHAPRETLQGQPYLGNAKLVPTSNGHLEVASPRKHHHHQHHPHHHHSPQLQQPQQQQQPNGAPSVSPRHGRLKSRTADDLPSFSLSPSRQPLPPNDYSIMHPMKLNTVDSVLSTVMLSTPSILPAVQSRGRDIKGRHPHPSFHVMPATSSSSMKSPSHKKLHPDQSHHHHHQHNPFTLPPPPYHPSLLPPAVQVAPKHLAPRELAQPEEYVRRMMTMTAMAGVGEEEGRGWLRKVMTSRAMKHPSSSHITEDQITSLLTLPASLCTPDHPPMNYQLQRRFSVAIAQIVHHLDCVYDVENGSVAKNHIGGGSSGGLDHKFSSVDDLLEYIRSQAIAYAEEVNRQQQQQVRIQQQQQQWSYQQYLNWQQQQQQLMMQQQQQSQNQYQHSQHHQHQQQWKDGMEDETKEEEVLEMNETAEEQQNDSHANGSMAEPADEVQDEEEVEVAADPPQEAPEEPTVIDHVQNLINFLQDTPDISTVLFTSSSDHPSFDSSSLTYSTLTTLSAEIGYEITDQSLEIVKEVMEWNREVLSVQQQQALNGNGSSGDDEKNHDTQPPQQQQQQQQQQVLYSLTTLSDLLHLLHKITRNYTNQHSYQQYILSSTAVQHLVRLLHDLTLFDKKVVVEEKEMRVLEMCCDDEEDEEEEEEDRQGEKMSGVKTVIRLLHTLSSRILTPSTTSIWISHSMSELVEKVQMLHEEEKMEEKEKEEEERRKIEAEIEQQEEERRMEKEEQKREEEEEERMRVEEEEEAKKQQEEEEKRRREEEEQKKAEEENAKKLKEEEEQRNEEEQRRVEEENAKKEAEEVEQKRLEEQKRIEQENMKQQEEEQRKVEQQKQPETPPSDQSIPLTITSTQEVNDLSNSSDATSSTANTVDRIPSVPTESSSSSSSFPTTSSNKRSSGEHLWRDRHKSSERVNNSTKSNDSSNAASDIALDFDAGENVITTRKLIQPVTAEIARVPSAVRTVSIPRDTPDSATLTSSISTTVDEPQQDTTVSVPITRAVSVSKDATAIVAEPTSIVADSTTEVAISSPDNTSTTSLPTSSAAIPNQTTEEKSSEPEAIVSTSEPKVAEPAETTPANSEPSVALNPPHATSTEPSSTQQLEVQQVEAKVTEESTSQIKEARSDHEAESTPNVNEIAAATEITSAAGVTEAVPVTEDEQKVDFPSSEKQDEVQVESVQESQIQPEAVPQNEVAETDSLKIETPAVEEVTVPAQSDSGAVVPTNVIVPTPSEPETVPVATPLVTEVPTIEKQLSVPAVTAATEVVTSPVQPKLEETTVAVVVEAEQLEQMTTEVPNAVEATIKLEPSSAASESSSGEAVVSLPIVVVAAEVTQPADLVPAASTPLAAEVVSSTQQHLVPIVVVSDSVVPDSTSPSPTTRRTHHAPQASLETVNSLIQSSDGGDGEDGTNNNRAHTPVSESVYISRSTRRSRKAQASISVDAMSTNSNANTDKDNPLDGDTNKHRRGRSYLSRNRESSDSPSRPSVVAESSGGGTSAEKTKIDDAVLPTLLEIEQNGNGNGVDSGKQLEVATSDATSSVPLASTPAPGVSSVRPSTISYPYTLPPLTPDTDLILDLQCEALDNIHMLMVSSPYIEVYLCTRADPAGAALEAKNAAAAASAGNGTSSGGGGGGINSTTSGGGAVSVLTSPTHRSTSSSSATLSSSTSIRARGFFYDSLYRSETHIRGGTSPPSYKKAVISAAALGLGQNGEEYERELLIRVYDESRSGEESIIMGEVTMKVKELLLGLYGNLEISSRKGILEKAQQLKLPLIRYDIRAKQGKAYTNSGFLLINSCERMKKIDRIPSVLPQASSVDAAIAAVGLASEHGNGSGVSSSSMFISPLSPTASTHSERPTTSHSTAKTPRSKKDKSRHSMQIKQSVVAEESSSGTTAAGGGGLGLEVSTSMSISPLEQQKRNALALMSSPSNASLVEREKEKDKDKDKDGKESKRDRRRRSGKKKKSSTRKDKTSTDASDTDTGLSELDEDVAAIEFPSMIVNTLSSPKNSGTIETTPVLAAAAPPPPPAPIPIPFTIESPPHYLSQLTLSAHGLPKPAWYSLSDPHPFLTVSAKKSVLQAWKARIEGNKQSSATSSIVNGLASTKSGNNTTPTTSTMTVKKGVPKSKPGSRSGTPTASKRGSLVSRAIGVLSEQDSWVTVYTSEIKRDTLAPDFSPFFLSLNSLSNLDWDASVQISVSYSNSLEKVVKPDIVGSAVLSVRELITGSAAAEPEEANGNNAATASSAATNRKSKRATWNASISTNPESSLSQQLGNSKQSRRRTMTSKKPIVRTDIPLLKVVTHDGAATTSVVGKLSVKQTSLMESLPEVRLASSVAISHPTTPPQASTTASIVPTPLIADDSSSVDQMHARRKSKDVNDKLSSLLLNAGVEEKA